MSERVEISTKRFLLRELTVNDASERYLDWMRDDDTMRYISFATTKRTLSDLREYILERADRDDVLFLGIFDKKRDPEKKDVKRGTALTWELVA